MAKTNRTWIEYKTEMAKNGKSRLKSLNHKRWMAVSDFKIDVTLDILNSWH